MHVKNWFRVLQVRVLDWFRVLKISRFSIPGFRDSLFRLLEILRFSILSIPSFSIARFVISHSLF